MPSIFRNPALQNRSSFGVGAHRASGSDPSEGFTRDREVTDPFAADARTEADLTEDEREQMELVEYCFAEVRRTIHRAPGQRRGQTERL